MQNGSNLKNREDFVIRYKSEDGNMFEGTFTVKRLAIKDRSKIGRIKSDLSGGMYCVRDEEGKPTGQGLDDATDYLNNMIAHLEVVIVRSPQWFDLNEITDIGLVSEIFNKWAEFEVSFFRSPDESDGRRGHAELGEGNSSKESTQPKYGNVPAPVVGQEVQASLDA